jgi:hypothetical protein
MWNGRSALSRHIRSVHFDRDRATSGAVFARNRGMRPSDRVSLSDMGGRQTSWTADRREFIGRNGCLADPAALATASSPAPLVRVAIRALQTAMDAASPYFGDALINGGHEADSALSASRSSTRC